MSRSGAAELSRLSEIDLHVDQPRGLPRHSRPKKLADGDIVNIDVTVIVDGWHGDTSRMFLVGNVGVQARRLVDVTYEATMRGIEQVKPGATVATSVMRSRASPRATDSRWCAISAAMASAKVFHDTPSILHFNKPGAGPPEARHVLHGGADDQCRTLGSEDWTTAGPRSHGTRSSAQFEHTVGVTETATDLHRFAQGARSAALRRLSIVSEGAQRNRITSATATGCATGS